MSSSSATVNTEDLYSYIDTFFQKKYILTVIIIIVIIYLLSTLGKSTPKYSDNYLGKSNSSSGGGFLTTLIILFIIVLVIAGLLQFFFGINVVLSFKNFFKKEVKLVATELPLGNTGHIPQIFHTKQVFNIPGNNYTYENAQELCKAYGADLANYSQMEDAYKRGANWCNYGWSQDQMAFFPTQQSTYDNLQQVKGHENDCGRPGINGGYMANPFNRYGVNCYGVKPAINSEEKALMEINKSQPEDAQLNASVNFWKNQIPHILVSPFNSTTWSKL
jgi:uncharacterized membrane protein YciS (DUF1049 family)